MAELTFNHASEYAIVLNSEPMNGSDEPGENESIGETAGSSENENPGETESGADESKAESPRTGYDNIWNIAGARNAAWLLCFAVLLGAAVLISGAGVFCAVMKKKTAKR